MIVVVGSRFDPAAVELASAWQHAGAVLCDANDATSPGWRYEPHDPSSAVAVAEGRRVRAGEIDAVVTLRVAVDPAELLGIVPDDRAFVAAEVNAFLHAFLTALRAPVANRPAGYSLGGALLGPEEWLRVARDAAVPSVAIERTVPGNIAPAGCDLRATRSVFVTGERAIGDADPRLRRHAVAIARRCGATTLEAIFAGDRDARFVTASAQPSLRDPARRDALLSAIHAWAVAV